MVGRYRVDQGRRRLAGGLLGSGLGKNAAVRADLVITDQHDSQRGPCPSEIK